MTGLSRDLRVAVRTLAGRPGFTAAIVLTLALGIGGATTMYGFLQAVVRQGRPTVPEPERVARLFTATSPRDEKHGLVTFGDYRRWGAAARSFESLDPPDEIGPAAPQGRPLRRRRDRLLSLARAIPLELTRCPSALTRSPV